MGKRQLHTGIPDNEPWPRALTEIADDEGYSDVEEMLQRLIIESVVPGMCRDCSEITYRCEPDARNNWCNNCGSNGVESVYVIAGLH